MEKTDEAAFLQLMIGLGEFFEKTLSGPVMIGYFDALSDLPLETVKRAMTLSRRKCRWLPKPVELRELVEGDADDSALIAWQSLLQAEMKAGTKSVLFEDGAIVEAMRRVFGSWSGFLAEIHPVYAPADSIGFKERGVMLSDRHNPNDSDNLVQVSGLSPEMIRAKQKEFMQAYRQAQREGHGKPVYVKGQSEVECGNATLLRGKALPKQPIWIQARNEGREVMADCDERGQVTASVQALLRSAEYRPALPPSERKMLGPVEPEPEDVKAGRAAFARQSQMQPKAAITPEEFEARRNLIREQAQAIKQNIAGAQAAEKADEVLGAEN